METPKSGHQNVRSMRNHTPKLSERKKKLFETTKCKEIDPEEDELLNGIEPLPKMKSRSGNKTPKICAKTVESLMGSCKKSPRVISFFESESEECDTGEEQKNSPSRRSIRLSLKKSRKPEPENSISSHKENIPIKTPTRSEAQEDKQLQKLFNNSMQITPRNKSMIVEETSSEDEINSCRNSTNKINLNKRNYETVDSTGSSPARKVAKIGGVSISTASFYSTKNRTPQTNTSSRPSCRNLFGHSFHASSTNSRSKQTPRRSLGLQSISINRGVHHKIRKRPNNLSLAAKHYAPVDIDQILTNVRNEKLRRIITAKREERQQIEKIHNILRKASNPIAMARPLSSISSYDDSNNNLSTNDIKQKTSLKSLKQQVNVADADFSDIECDEEIVNDCEQNNLKSALMDMNEEVIPLITYQTDDVVSAKSEDSSASVKRKFFKSGRTTSTPKEVYLTDNIKATVTANGKIAIVPEKTKIKKRFKIRSSAEFSDEQATVDAILRNLDDTAFGDTVLPTDDEVQNTTASNDNLLFDDEIDQQLALLHDEGDSSHLIDDIVLQDNQDFYEFRRRLPYNTTDPEIIERQHLLLDFLITNNICTEENFNIFIADPDNHKAEAEKIIDDLVIIVTDQQNTDFRQRIPYNTTDPAVIEQQHNFLDFLLENNICTEDNFDIFIANYGQKKAEAAAIFSQYASNTNNGQYTENVKELMKISSENCFFSQKEGPNKGTIQANNVALTGENFSTLLTPTNNDIEDVPSVVHTSTNNISQDTDQRPQQKLYPVFYPGGCQVLPQISTSRKQQRLWNGGYGLNQYQIDAGQKEFGAHQCKQCGLVYTVHEPEEEKLHRDFHASLHILRFKGWIDEDIVAIYTEWGTDGRILRLTEASPIKRRERLFEILKIVDKELGFSSYVMPKTFVGYLAVRKMQIVGLCLVQPLSKANKYMCINGVDCCTEEQFEAKCGISRIWISPLHRRLHIGSKLIQAVQLNTIFGEEIPLDEIAFSAPTELGKKFAQAITKNENFLVYQ